MAVGGILMILVGLVSLSGAVFEWDWFMNSGRARFFVGLLGHQGTRILYSLLGLIFVVVGIYAMASV